MSENQRPLTHQAAKATWRQRLLRPARWVMDRLTYPRKFALVSMLFMLPLAAVMYFLLAEVNSNIEFARKELDGTRYLRAVRQLQHQIGQGVHAAQRYAHGKALLRPELIRKQADIDDALARLEAVDAELGARLGTKTVLAVLLENRRFLRAALFGKDLENAVDLHRQLLADVERLTAHVGDSSNLILDPDLDSYYLMDVAVVKLPAIANLLVQTRALLATVAHDNRVTAAAQADIARLAGMIQEAVLQDDKALKVAYANTADKSLKTAIGEIAASYEIGLTRLAAGLRGDFGASADLGQTTARLDVFTAEAILNNVALGERIILSLDGLLQARIDKRAWQQRWILLFSLVSLLLVAYLLAAFYSSVMHIVQRLHTVSARMQAGDFEDTLTLETRDELGQVATAFNAVAVRLQAEKRQAEQESARARAAETGLLAQEKELVASRELAMEAARAKAAFLATMSHEIRTPLNGVVGMTTLLADTVLTAEQRDYLQTMRVSSDQLLGVINDILDYSKIESGKLELENEVLNLRSTMEESCEIAATRAREKGLELIADLDDNVPPWVRGDVTRLRQVLLNFINNAVKFTDQGQVVVSAHVSTASAQTDSATGTLIEFRVKDSGIGIPPERQGALFQSFSQVDASTTRKYGGTGLGLAICKRLAELMGGGVGLSSEAGKGSTFWFSARLQHAQAPANAMADAVPLAGLTGKSVVVVDDTPLNLRILDKQLHRWGMNTTLFERTAPALDWIAEQAVDLVITDMHMPDMDGQEFAQILRQRALPTKIVLVTSGTMPAGDAGKVFDARLLKPYRQSQLFNALTRVLSDGAEPQQVPVAAAPAPSKNQCILVVDDIEVNLKVALALLRKLGYEATTASTGLEAARLVSESLKTGGRRFAAVLMDCNMPVMDGYEATRKIIAAHADAAPPIIALTASVLEEDRRHCADAGMRGFLGKPLAINDVAETLARYAPRTTQANDSTPQSHTPLSSTRTQAANSVEPATALIDWSRLQQFSEIDQQDRSVTREIIALFIAATPVQLKELAQACHEHDGTTLFHAAHALKGAASNVGASALSSACAVLERSSAQGLWPQDAAAQVALIKDLTGKSLTALKGWHP